VPGLRRSEVADLAGASVEYYAQLERGDLSGASDSVLEALALHLDEAEQQHLADLARAAGPGSRIRRKPPAQPFRPSVARILELMTDVPAFVGNGRGDVIAKAPDGKSSSIDHVRSIQGGAQCGADEARMMSSGANTTCRCR
jgi:hypothetical protein